MNIATYLAQKRARELAAFQPRPCCGDCARPLPECYCAVIRPHSSQLQIALLVHPDEARRGIATARLAKRCLSNALWFEGFDFRDHAEVNALIASPDVAPLLLYPGPKSRNLSAMTADERRAVFAGPKRPILFVVDGTWRHSRRMLRFSPNLQALPMISFSPTTPSRFRVRKQPRAYCYSTVEAIHHVLDLVEGDVPTRPHDNLIEAFDHMVERQLLHVSRGALRPYHRGLRVRSVDQQPHPELHSNSASRQIHVRDESQS